MKKKQEETYSLTFRGLVFSHLAQDEAQKFLDVIELYLRRMDKNAIILTGAGTFEMHKVYIEEK